MLKVRQIRRVGTLIGLFLILALAMPPAHSVLAAALPAASLSGYVYCDLNHNGIMDDLEWAIADAQILLTSSSGGTTQSTLSSSNGFYSFSGLSADTYSIQITPYSTSGQDTGAGQMIFDNGGTSIVSVGTAAGSAVQNAYFGITLTDGQSGTNFNFAESQYPVELMSARMTLNSRQGSFFTKAVTVPSITSPTGSTLDLGNVLVTSGTVTSSGTATLTVANNGGQGSLLSGDFPAATGEFGPNASTSFDFINAGGTASQVYTYTPTKRGSDTQDISVSTRDTLTGNSIGNLKVTLKGNGVAPLSSLTSTNPVITLVGNTASTSSGTITITNTGDGNLSQKTGDPSDKGNLTGHFSAYTGVFSSAIGTLSLGDKGSQSDSKSFVFNYKPTKKGTDTQAITVNFDNGNPDGTNASGSLTTTFTGTAVAPVSQVNTSFPSFTLVGGTSSGTITVTNIGNGNLSNLGEISNLHGSLTGGTGSSTFSGTGGSLSLLDNGVKTFNYNFAPKTRGGSTYAISDSFDNGNPNGTNTASSGTITLNGMGVAPQLSLTQTTPVITLVNGTSSGTITVTNVGDGNLAGTGTQYNLNGTISGGTGTFTSTAGSVSLLDSTSGPLAITSQNFGYVFTPTIRGANTSVITTNFQNGSADGKNSASTPSITLTGTGVAPQLLLTQTTPAGFTLVNGTATATITVKNIGDGSLAGTGSQFNLNGTLSGGTGTFVSTAGSVSVNLLDNTSDPLAVNSQTFGYIFKPTVRGDNSAVITTSFSNGSADGKNSPSTPSITLTGTGVAPQLLLTPTDAYALVSGTGTGSIKIENIGDGNKAGSGGIYNLNGSLTGSLVNLVGVGGSVSLADSTSGPLAITSHEFDYTFQAAASSGTISTVISAVFSNGNPNQTNTPYSQNVTLTGHTVAPVLKLTPTDAYALVGGTGTGNIKIENIGDGNKAGSGGIYNLSGSLSQSLVNLVGAGGSVSLADSTSGPLAITSHEFDYTFQAAASRGTISTVISAVFSNGNPNQTNTAYSQNVTLTGHTVAPIQKVDLGAFNVGVVKVRIGTSATGSVTVSNIGDGNKSGLGDPSNLKGKLALIADQFVLAAGTINLADGGTVSFPFTYKPTNHAADSKTISLDFANGKDDGSNLAQSISAVLNGQGVGPTYSSDTASGSTLDFGPASVPQASTKSLFLKISNISTDPNDGNATLTDLTLSNAMITGTDGALFSILGFTAGKVLQKGDQLTLEIKYLGTGTHGPHTDAKLNIFTDEGAAFGASGNSFNYPISITLAPEPGSLAMLAGAAMCFGGLIWRRRRKTAA